MWRGGSYGSEPLSAEVPLSSEHEVEAGGRLPDPASVRALPRSLSSSWAPGRVKESSTMMLNGALDAKRAPVTLCPGQGCQEEGGTTLQGRPWHW